MSIRYSQIESRCSSGDSFGTPFVSGRLLALLIVAPVAVLYLALPLHNYTDAKDSLAYAFQIREGVPFFHPNHLLYEPLNFVIHRTVVWLFGSVDPLRTMQLLSTVSAICTLYLICRIAQRWEHRVFAGSVAVGAIAFSFGIWCYSISPDGYLPPLLCVFLTIALLDPGRWRLNDISAPSLAICFFAAMATAAAVLLHQMYLFFAIVMGAVILLSPEFGLLSQRIRIFCLYGGVSGVIVAGVYAGVFWTLQPVDSVFVDWARGYAAKGLFWDSAPSTMTPILGAIGALTSMFSINALMAFDSIANMIVAWAPSKSLGEERYIGEMFIGRNLAVFVLLATVMTGVSWIAFAGMAVADSIQRTRRKLGGNNFVVRLLGVLVIVYSVLVLVWEPGNREFWIHVYVFATLWCVMTTNIHHLRTKLVGITLSVGLFFSSYFGAIQALSTENSDYWRMFHRKSFENVMTSDYDVVLISCNYLCRIYLRYFHVSNVVVPDVLKPQKYVTELARYSPERILVSKWFLTPHESYNDNLTNLPIAKERYETVLNEFRKAYPGAIPLILGDASYYRFDNGKLVPAESH